MALYQRNKFVRRSCLDKLEIHGKGVHFRVITDKIIIKNTAPKFLQVYKQIHFLRLGIQIFRSRLK
jgi:hypothetical protein